MLGVVIFRLDLTCLIIDILLEQHARLADGKDISSVVVCIAVIGLHCTVERVFNSADLVRCRCLCIGIGILRAEIRMIVFAEIDGIMLTGCSAEKVAFALGI